MEQTVKRFSVSNAELLRLTQFTHKLFNWVAHSHGRERDDARHEALVSEYVQLYPLIKRTHFEPHSVVYELYPESRRGNYFETLAQDYMSASRTQTLKPEDFAQAMGEFDERSQNRPPRIVFRLQEKTVAKQVIEQLKENQDVYTLIHAQRADPLIKSFLDRRHRMQSAMRKANAQNPHYYEFMWEPPVFEAFKRVVLAITYEKEALQGDRSFLEKWFLMNNSSSKVELGQRTEGAMEELKTTLASCPKFAGPEFKLSRLDFLWSMEKTIENELSRQTQTVRPPRWQDKIMLPENPSPGSAQNARG